MARAGLPAALAALLVLGCAGTQLQREAASLPQASHYATEVPAGDAVCGELAAELARGLADGGAARAGLIGDPRLAQLARRIALATTADGRTPELSALDEVARGLGLVEPLPHFVVLQTNAATQVRGSLAHELSELLRAQRYTHYGACGVRLRYGYAVVLVLSFRELSLSPVPRVVAPGDAIVLRGPLAKGFDRPALAVTRPDGRVLRGEPLQGSTLAVRIPTREAGVYRIEVLAEGPHGTAVVANFPVYAGVPPSVPRRLAPVTRPESDTSPEQALLALVAQARQQAGAPALTLDAALSEVARAHVLDMLEHGFIGHTSKSSGGAADRVTAAGIAATLVLENIGRGASIAEIHHGLLASPGHRANLLEPRATHLGLAVASTVDGGKTTYVITQLLIRRPSSR